MGNSIEEAEEKNNNNNERDLSKGNSFDRKCSREIFSLQLSHCLSIWLDSFFRCRISRLIEFSLLAAKTCCTQICVVNQLVLLASATSTARTSRVQPDGRLFLSQQWHKAPSAAAFLSFGAPSSSYKLSTAVHLVSQRIFVRPNRRPSSNHWTAPLWP